MSAKGTEVDGDAVESRVTVTHANDATPAHTSGREAITGEREQTPETCGNEAGE